MRFPRWYAKWNRFATNKLVSLWAGRVTGMGLLHHVGRRSGRLYRTPLVVFPLDERSAEAAGFGSSGGLVVQVGYGPKTEWLQNVHKAGHAEMKYRNQSVPLAAPTLMSKSEASKLVPRAWRAFYRVVPFDEAAVFPRATASGRPSET